MPYPPRPTAGEPRLRHFGSQPRLKPRNDDQTSSATVTAPMEYDKFPSRKLVRDVGESSPEESGMENKDLSQSLGFEKEIAKDVKYPPSIASSITSAETAVESTGTAFPFTPSKSLFINSHGIRLVRLPVPSSELEINIHRSDGSVAYTSKRDKRCSGDATLSTPETGDMLKTIYFFGPNRDPVIRPISKTVELDDEPESSNEATGLEIKVTSRWKSRTQYFTTLYGDSFQWRYVRCDDPQLGCKKLLVLEKLDNNNPNSVGRRIAQLVRNEQTRPPGTTKTTAGNGGELVLDADAMGVEIDEALVVATCLLMLKKEVDRRRMVQMMVLGGMLSAG
ncbi:predicted protein [Uncinocarpus reesii 1704]|uniref:Uncharacterized protein n=1 Tax=Uncinocarpus reesii (strain UAMH 1704) TaxID=336963 RepID=C4JW12_UNCRE|nr:uncharacterized protein UREG_06754 [Uncinocarpus reesii 1704]EEP81889.1 predicted protein [Uncinocarpus reesii 1704]